MYFPYKWNLKKRELLLWIAKFLKSLELIVVNLRKVKKLHIMKLSMASVFGEFFSI